MFLGQLPRLAGVTAQGDELALLNTCICQRPKKFPHGLDAHIPRLPLFALNCGALPVLLYNQINATVRICAATTGYTVSLFLVNVPELFFELKPVDGTKLFDESTCG